MQENKETWKDIVGFEGHYQVSNTGRVKSLKGGKERVMKPGNTIKYLLITLSNGSLRKSFGVHRLVGQAFIENPLNKPQINHKDGNKKNNKVENLEWSTALENTLHSMNVLGNVHGPLGYRRYPDFYCSNCKTQKERSDFYRNNSKNKGRDHESECKKCRVIYLRLHRRNRRLKQLAPSEQRSEEHENN